MSTNQGTNEDDSQSDPHPEAGILTNQMTQNSSPEDEHYMVTGVTEQTRNEHYMVTGVQRERERERERERVFADTTW